jgi:cellulose synthase/poly-beta-1,6-N-acetylglucosamine synthase-like glycosyltransferase
VLHYRAGGPRYPVAGRRPSREASPMTSENTLSTAPALSIVVPLYNEEANVHALYERLRAVVESMGVSYEFVFIWCTA